MSKPAWFREHLGTCWCDPDRDDIFAIDCPTHGIPRSSLHQMACVRWTKSLVKGQRLQK